MRKLWKHWILEKFGEKKILFMWKEKKNMWKISINYSFFYFHEKKSIKWLFSLFKLSFLGEREKRKIIEKLENWGKNSEKKYFSFKRKKKSEKKYIEKYFWEKNFFEFLLLTHEKTSKFTFLKKFSEKKFLTFSKISKGKKIFQYFH